MYYANILTGSIGCGKSTTARLLALHGFKIIDADEIAHKALEESKECIIETFGNEILAANTEVRQIDRAKLGNIVFQDSNKKVQLEDILHPIIHKNIIEDCINLEAKKTPFFIDIPLYFESKYIYPARFVICVYAARNIQIQRLQDRNGLSMQEAINRIESQIDIETKRDKSDFIIDNTSDLKTLQKNIESFLKIFLKHYS